MAKSHEGRIAVITGAAGGLGQTFAIRMAKKGCHLALTDIEPLYAHTTLHVPTEKFQPPHAIGLIDTPEGARVFSRLVIDERGFKIGAEMEMTVDTLWTEDDKEVVGYRFRMV